VLGSLDAPFLLLDPDFVRRGRGADHAGYQSSVDRRPRQRMGTILLVDDNRDILQLFSALLEEAGHVVVTAVNGREALEIALKSRPDLIISDWMMPEMDGVALFHAVRGTPATAKIPIILTAAARPAPDIAVQAILLKPFQMPQLFRLIELYAKPTE